MNIQGKKIEFHEEGTTYHVEGKLKKIVNVSSDQILQMGTTPIELLPIVGDRKYYAVESVAVEFTDNGTPYTIGTGANPYIFISLNATANMFLQKAFITTSGNKAFHFTHFEGGLDTTNSLNFQYSGTAENKSLQFKTWGNVNPTLGNGTLRLIIIYSIRTFGE